MSDSLPTVIDLLTRTDFLIGGFLGFAGLVVLFFTSQAERGSVLGWGLTLTSAAFLAVSLAIGARLSLLAALSALALGGWMARPPSGSARAPFGWAVIAIGAVAMIWRGGFPEIGWLLVLAPVVIVAIGSALAAWTTRLPNDAVGIMFAITAFGIWVTVPETEGARALLGASLPMALATLRPVRARLGYAGGFALAGLMVWVVATGGEARPASIIGGWACIGALAVLPLYRPTPAWFVGKKAVLTVALHAVLVLVASRVIGLWESGGLALIAVVILGAAVYFGLGRLPRIKAESIS
ncbi:MAG: hypothetical protein M3P87_00460 [Actinomycetota bacterium]|nr:hypothetical protein [Actinomycetota bacterium]